MFIAFRLVFKVLQYDVYDEEWVEVLCSVLRLVRQCPNCPKRPNSPKSHDCLTFFDSGAHCSQIRGSTCSRAIGGKGPKQMAGAVMVESVKCAVITMPVFFFLNSGLDYDYV